MRRAALALAVQAACGENEASAPAADEAEPLVEVARAELRSVERSISAVATIEPAETIILTSPVSGTVQSIHFEEGDELAFEPGRSPILFRLASSTLNNAVQAAERQLDTVEAKLAEAEGRFSRQDLLLGDKATTRAEYEDAKYALERAKASRARAQAAVVAARRQAAQTTIRAPSPGIIAKRFAGVGEFVQPGKRLVEILDRGQMFAVFFVPEARLSEVAAGAPAIVSVDALRRRDLAGTVSFVAPRVDPATLTVRVKVRLAAPDDDLRSGMSARVRVTTDAKAQTVVVPEEAVHHRPDGLFVYVVEDKRVSARKIVVQRRFPGEVVASEGLAGGEDVVVRGLQQVRDEMIVRTRSASAEESESAK